MVYLTGDIHGDSERVVQLCLSMKPRRTDTLGFCGHWHIDKRIDKMHFLFKSIEGQ